MYKLSMNSPIGTIEIREEQGVILSLHIGTCRPGNGESTSLLERALTQLEEYFQKPSNSFDLPLSPAATTFQENVRTFMLNIPPGETRTYGEAAQTLSTSPRAIGRACGKNPIPIIVPCHRVVGATGELIGFSGGEGIATKRFLLDLESTP